MAREFNGSTQYCTYTGITQVTGGGKIAISCWFRQDAYGGSPAAFNLVNVRNGDSGNGNWTGIRTGTVDGAEKLLFTHDFFRSGSLGELQTATTTVDDGVWRHGLGYYDGSKLRVYINGILEASSAGTNSSLTLDTTNTWALGRRSDYSTEFFDGSVCEVAVWKDVDITTFVASLGKGFSPLFFLNGLQLYIPMIGNTSPEIEVRAGKNATLVNTPTKYPHPRIIYPYGDPTGVKLPTLKEVQKYAR